MELSIKILRKLIKEVLEEADIEDISDVEFANGSTHVMSTCKIGNDKYYLKFSEPDLFYDVDPSLQILVEYLAYRIYALYSGIKIPKPTLVYDKENKRVGLATTPAAGRHANLYGDDLQELGKKMSQGVYVDIFLANWDVIGMGLGNVFTDKEIATRIDPGGSLTFRAQGGKKGSKFGNKVGELNSMLDPSFGGAGRVFKYSDLKIAAKEFLSVDWNKIHSEIENVTQEINSELSKKGMNKLSAEWKIESSQISSILSERYKEVYEHAKKDIEG